MPTMTSWLEVEMGLWALDSGGSLWGKPAGSDIGDPETVVPCGGPRGHMERKMSGQPQADAKSLKRPPRRDRTLTKTKEPADTQN